MRSWIIEALTGLHHRIMETGTDRESVRRIIDGLAITARGEIGRHVDGQKPSLYVPGLTAKPWWDTTAFPWVKGLEAHVPSLFRELADAGGVQPTDVEDGFLVRGRWSVRWLACLGRPDRASFDAFPRTLQLLGEIPGATTAGMAYFSSLGPATHIRPHSGFTNAHLRCHLTLVATDESRIRVGDEIRGWQPGNLLIFDDTFEHEVWNGPGANRLVLLFDIFHPELEGPEVDALTFVMQSLRQHFMRSFWSSVFTGNGPGIRDLASLM